ncbi:phosphoesterase RecJ-like protein [Bacillus tianshenii]|uniref:Phosphoesterase RecJ-like protein n=1 Tax=Sutcliffiella tianshenii TaxID=1463404 RepID=A0ABS2P1H3_9BACI|nr:bifunctional oligoribonuclease/PAP phosphatase NrnA [Bacillus tianshenii]MBM7620573.1 phosphoesterase RecJ-like protein [Bacillus tianshenii]
MKQQIIDEIKAHDTIIIHRHVRPDPDAYGSQCGLAEIIKETYPEKMVYRVGKAEESLNFLSRLDEIPDSSYEGALVIVCDTANAERICDERYKLASKLIKIDHHPNDDKYGDLVWVDTDASSTSEMIYELYLAGEHQGYRMTKESARLIFAGIVGDTGRFLFKSTNTKTFQYAGELLSYGFSMPDLYDQLYKMKLHVAKMSGYVLENFTLHEEGVASMRITKEVLQRYNALPSEASQLVGMLGNLEGIKAWVFFIEESDQIRVRLRSKGPIVNEVAKRYNGGGHPLASGASIYEWDEAEHVLSDLIETCRAQLQGE